MKTFNTSYKSFSCYYSIMNKKRHSLNDDRLYFANKFSDIHKNLTSAHRWRRLFCKFLVINYAFVSSVYASSIQVYEDQQASVKSPSPQYGKTEKVESQPEPLLENNITIPGIKKTNIPSHLFRITPSGIYLDNNLKSLERDLEIEAQGDLYISGIKTLGSLSINTTGKVFLLEDIFAEATVTIRAKEIDVQKKLKAKGRIQLLAESLLNLKGYINSKNILQLVGIERVIVTGLSKAREGIALLSGGKIYQNGTLVSDQEIAVNAHKFTQKGVLLSSSDIQVTTQEMLKLKAGSTIGARKLALLSKFNDMESSGEIYTEEGMNFDSSHNISIRGNLKSGGLVSVQAKNFTSSGVLSSANGATLNIENEWNQQGIFKAFGNGLHGKIGKFTNTGDIETQGVSLHINTGNNHKSFLTRGHYSLTGKTYVNHKGSVTFTTGVHHFDLMGDYIDSGHLYTPTLLIAKARHLQFLGEHRAFLKDALFSSMVQITVRDGANFDLFGPRIFLQFSSDGSVTFRGKASHNSLEQYPLSRYFTPFLGEESSSGHARILSTSQPMEAELKSEVEKLSINHPWRELKRGSGITITVAGDVKYAGTMKLDGGALSLNAGGSLHAEKGAMQAGYFTGDKIGIQAANMALDQTTIQTYFDKVALSSTNNLSLKKVEISAGMSALITALSIEIQKSKVASTAASVHIDGQRSADLDKSRLQSYTHTSVKANQVGLRQIDVMSGTQASFIADDQLKIEDSNLKSQGNALVAREMQAKKLSLQGDSSLIARNQVTIDSLTSTDKVKVVSDESVNLQGTLKTKEITSQAKRIVNDAEVIALGTAQLIADAVEQNRRIDGETVFIQAESYQDKASSKMIAKKTLVLLNEKGKGFSGQLEGDTVVIKMEDFQLAALKQVIANVTQLYLKADVIIDQDLVLNNTLQLWANKLINRSKVKVQGDFIAQINKEIQLNGQMDIAGMAVFVAGESIVSNQGRMTAEKIYLQAKKGDVSLYHALLKATMDVRIASEAANIKKTASKIQSGTDVFMSAAKNIEATSVANREGDKDNFEDKVAEDSIKAEKEIEMRAGSHILMTGVEHQAGSNITYVAGGSIVDAPLAIEAQQSSGDKKNHRFDRTVIQKVSHHQAEGTFTSHAGGAQELYAPQVEAKKIQISADQSVTSHEVHDTFEHRSKETHKGGFFGQDRKKKSFKFSALSKGMQLTATDSVEITSGQDVNLTYVVSNAPKTNLTAVAGAVRLLLGKSQSSSSTMEKSSNILWQSQKSHIEDHKALNASSFTGTLGITSKETFVEAIQGQTLSFSKQLENQGIKAIYSYLDEFHKDETKKTQGPSAALAVVVVLAVSICTAGAGAALGAAAAGAMSASGALATVITGMTAAGFTSLCSQAALALLSNEGNPIKAAESLASTRILETLGISMLTAGVTAGVSDVLQIPQSASQARTPLDHISKQAVQMSVNTTANMITGQNPKDALIYSAKSAAAGIIGGIASSRIGEAYFNHDIDFIGHKFLHALVGGTTGAILGKKPLEGAISGAFGAVTAEMIGELVLMNSHKIAGDIVDKLDNEKISLTQENIQNAVKEELTHKTDFIKLITSGIALITGQDVSIANFTAATAVDNNLSQIASQITELEVYSILGRQGISCDLPANLKLEDMLLASSKDNALPQSVEQSLTSEQKQAEALEISKTILALDELGLKLDDINPETMRAFASILRSAAPLEIFNEDPKLLYKYLSKIHLESYTEGKGINPIGLKKPTTTPLPIEEITVRHARPGDIKNKGTDRTSWTTDDVKAVDIALKEGSGRDQVVVTNEKKLERLDIETKNTSKLLEETQHFKELYPDHKGVAAAEFHYPDKKEAQTVGKVPNEATRKLRFYEGRSPTITKVASKVLPIVGQTLGTIGTVATLTQDSPAKMTVVDPFDVHYGEQSFNEAAGLIEQVILKFGGTVTYVNPVTNERQVIEGTPFWKSH